MKVFIFDISPNGFRTMAVSMGFTSTSAATSLHVYSVELSLNVLSLHIKKLPYGKH